MKGEYNKAARPSWYAASVTQILVADRNLLVRRGKRLEYLSIAWNSVECAVAIVAGILAGSISLLGFGLDSLIEVASSATLLWRMSVDEDAARRRQNDRAALRIVGICFVALSIYVFCDAVLDLWRKQAPEHSVAGIILAIAALIAMPLLARAKRTVASGLHSAAMNADARQADFCQYLAAILLFGLLLNMAFGWWWSDPIAALLMTPLIAKEGIDALRGRKCDDCC